jgi:hypothetical protein
MKKGNISEAKVQRMRNIVKGDYTKSVKTQVGYKKSDKNVEGDIWEEGNKTWTIKNGIKQNVAKLQVVRDLIRMPLVCPHCSKIMKGHLDKFHWKVEKQCLSCHAKHVTQLRAIGKYEDFKKDILKKNKLAEISDLTYEFEEWLNAESTFVTEIGTVEDWQGGINKEKMREKFNTELAEWKKHLDEL